jgi:hypothetical protein
MRMRAMKTETHVYALRNNKDAQGPEKQAIKQAVRQSNDRRHGRTR